MAEEELSFVKAVIRGLLTAKVVKEPVGYNALVKAYFNEEQKPLPLFGYRSHADLLRSMNDVIKIIPGVHGRPDEIRLVPSSQSAHIEKLVQGQKMTGSRPRPFPTDERLAELGISMNRGTPTQDRRLQSAFQDPKMSPVDKTSTNLSILSNCKSSRLQGGTMSSPDKTCNEVSKQNIPLPYKIDVLAQSHQQDTGNTVQVHTMFPWQKYHEYSNCFSVI